MIEKTEKEEEKEEKTQKHDWLAYIIIIGLLFIFWQATQYYTAESFKKICPTDYPLLELNENGKPLCFNSEMTLSVEAPTCTSLNAYPSNDPTQCEYRQYLIKPEDSFLATTIIIILLTLFLLIKTGILQKIISIILKKEEVIGEKKPYFPEFIKAVREFALNEKGIDLGECIAVIPEPEHGLNSEVPLTYWYFFEKKPHHMKTYPDQAPYFLAVQSPKFLDYKDKGLIHWDDNVWMIDTKNYSKHGGKKDREETQRIFTPTPQPIKLITKEEEKSEEK